MSERKAINKYYPPDFDPSLLKSKKKKKNSQQNEVIKIRMMAPYSMRCLKCNEYIAERRSFNARKETTGEKYLNSIKIIRFHITCPRCNNHISFKTNPQTAGYTPEEGAVRNYESNKSTSNEKSKSKSKSKDGETEEELLQRLQQEEAEDVKFKLLQEKRKKNPFYSLTDETNNGDVLDNFEKRLIEQQRQQQIEQHLEELQTKNDQLQALGGEDKLAIEAKQKIAQQIDKLQAIQNELNDEEDQQKIQQAFSSSKRKADSEEVIETEPVPKKIFINSKITLKRKVKQEEVKKTPSVASPVATSTLSSVLGGYSSSSDED
ncbi:CWC16 protein [Scheffersomyces amazonensis]|uniref:CWC16 protein n=1 Tax=Scheffersomyces amazonensis TaxID=1078765 RepID=UPI00315D4F18